MILSKFRICNKADEIGDDLTGNFEGFAKSPSAWTKSAGINI